MSNNTNQIVLGLITRVNNLENSVDKDFTDIEDSIESLQNQVDTLKSAVDNNTADIVEVQNDVISLQSTTDDLITELTTTNSNVAALTNSVTTLTGNVATVTNNLNSLTGSFNTLSTAFATVRQFVIYHALCTFSGLSSFTSGTATVKLPLSSQFNPGNIFALSGTGNSVLTVFAPGGYKFNVCLRVITTGIQGTVILRVYVNGVLYDESQWYFAYAGTTITGYLVYSTLLSLTANDTVSFDVFGKDVAGACGGLSSSLDITLYQSV